MRENSSRCLYVVNDWMNWINWCFVCNGSRLYHIATQRKRTKILSCKRWAHYFPFHVVDELLSVDPPILFCFFFQNRFLPLCVSISGICFAWESNQTFRCLLMENVNSNETMIEWFSTFWHDKALLQLALYTCMHTHYTTHTQRTTEYIDDTIHKIPMKSLNHPLFFIFCPKGIHTDSAGKLHVPTKFNESTQLHTFFDSWVYSNESPSAFWLRQNLFIPFEWTK